MGSSVESRMRYLLLGAAVGTFALAPLPAQSSDAPAMGWSGLVMGPSAVAYDMLILEDRSRVLLPDTGATRDNVTRFRRFPVRLWMPAPSRPRTPLTFGDIIGSASAAESDPVVKGLRDRTINLHRYIARRYAAAGQVADSVATRDTADLTAVALGTRTHAYRSVSTVSKRKRPLLLFAGGSAHSTDENVALWEYLASYGYIVAVIPTVAAHAKAPDTYLPANALGLETTARDLEFTLARLRARTDVDANRVGGLGFSYGAAAALVMAARNPDIRAIVGFDASFIANRHLPAIRSSPLFNAARIRAPIMEFHRADTTAVDLSLLEAAVHSRRTSFEITGLDHVDFNSYTLLYGPLLGSRAARASRDSMLTRKADAYRAMVETTRWFLDGALWPERAARDSVDARIATERAWARIPEVSVRIRRWPAQ